jgi:hypothetical protein
MAVTKSKQLTKEMITLVVEMLFTDFNSMSIIGFFKCIRKGMIGGYGKFYQLDVSTIGGWLHVYNNEEQYENRIQQLREQAKSKSAQDLSQYPSKYADALRKAIGKRKPAQYVPKQKHLDLFKQVITLYNEKALQQALIDWQPRQRPQYVELILKEQEKRNKK